MTKKAYSAPTLTVFNIASDERIAAGMCEAVSYDDQAETCVAISTGVIDHCSSPIVVS